MVKLINSPESFVADYLSGLALANEKLISVHHEPCYVSRKTISHEKVAIISGGGSGHEPLHAGYVGTGMLDIAIPGDVFSSPSANQILSAINSISCPRGALLIVKNYQGDVMNFEIAAEQLNIKHEILIVRDDCSTQRQEDARGLAATIVLEKMLGAAAEEMISLSALKSLGHKILSHAASFGIQSKAGNHPHLQIPINTEHSREIEVGVGIHGEKGHHKAIFTTIIDYLDVIITPVWKRINLCEGDNVLVIVNGLGATPCSELHICFYHISEFLKVRGISISHSLVGNYMTSLDGQGISVTLCKLDDELSALWEAPVNTPSLYW